MKRSGFTLIELLGVLAVVGLLAVILVPSLTTGLAKARRAQCLNNLRSLGSVMSAYGADHRGKMPSVGSGGDYETLTAMVKGLYEDEYLESFEVLACPTDDGRTACRGNDADAFSSKSHCSYVYFEGYNPLKADGDLNRLPLFCDRARSGGKGTLTEKDNHGTKYRNVVYLGGNAVTLRSVDEANGVVNTKLPDGVSLVE